MNRKEYNNAVLDYSDALYNYLVKTTHCKHDAEDIMQEVFEKLWSNRKKIRTETAKSWLFKVAHNSFINYARKKSRMVTTNQIGNWMQGCRRDEFSLENKELVDRAIKVLPPKQQSILLLRDIEGYHYDEIAEILSISQSQVKVYLFRARKKIKETLTIMLSVA